MKKLFTILWITIILTGCGPDDFGEQLEGEEYLFSQEGFFIVNEGNFSHSNGSVSFYSFDSSKVYNHIFFSGNQRPLGDVVNHLSFTDSLAIIAVNNSSKIETVDAKTFLSGGGISVGNSPREVAVVNKSKAYVSDLYSDSLTIINPMARKVEKRIYLGRSSEEMVIAGDKLWVANWSQLNHPDKENDKIMVIAISEDRLVDSVQVVKEPNSMVLDQNGFLWVLSSGGFMNEEVPALQKINTEDMQVVKRFFFPGKVRSPDNLVINAEGDKLFFLDNGVYAMDIDAESLPEEPVIAEEDRLFYALGTTGEKIVVSDAVDYQQRGIVYVYDKTYQLQTSFRAGIIPGYFATFKPSKNFFVERVN